ncbi:hypothetical protein HSX11_00405 [Oxalobacteraceae bacterium]|nr:hypothetical protein [Oxalobacteraceae bacterium]
MAMNAQVNGFKMDLPQQKARSRQQRKDGLQAYCFTLKPAGVQWFAGFDGGNVARLA